MFLYWEHSCTTTYKRIFLSHAVHQDQLQRVHRNAHHLALNAPRHKFLFLCSVAEYDIVWDRLHIMGCQTISTVFV